MTKADQPLVPVPELKEAAVSPPGAAAESTKAPNDEAQVKAGASKGLTPPVKPNDSLVQEKEAILSPAQETGATKPVSGKDTSKDPSHSVGKSEPVVKEPPLKIPVLKDSSPAVVAVPLPTAPKEPVPEAKTTKPVAAVTNEPLAKPSTPTRPVSPGAEGGKDSGSDKSTGKNEWVNALSEKSWVLQLAAMPTKAEVLELKAKTPAYASAQVLLTRNPQSNKPYFILVRGPFASKEEAQSVIQSNPAMEKAWLRSAKSLKAQFKSN